MTPLSLVALFAIGLVAGGALAVGVKRRRAAEGDARFEAALAEARAAFARVMEHVPALEEENAELASDVKLTAALAAKKLDGIQQDVDKSPHLRGMPLTVTRVDKARRDLEQLHQELSEGRPAAQGEVPKPRGKNLTILE